MKLHTSNLIKKLLNLPRNVKVILAILFDSIVCIISVWVSYYLRIGDFTFYTSGPYNIISCYLISVSLFLISFGFFKLYKSLFRYISKKGFFIIIKALSFYSMFFFLIVSIYSFSGIPRTVGIIQPIILFIMISLSRYFISIILNENFGNYSETNTKNILIYEADEKNSNLADILQKNPGTNIIGFIDKNLKLNGQLLNGIKIYNVKQLSSLSRSIKINEILLANPKINRDEKNDLLKVMQDLNIAVRIIPNLNQIISGKQSELNFVELNIHDLLHRDPVKPNKKLLKSAIYNKIILVTGAGGSIGSSLCLEISKLNPKKLLLLDQSEYNLYNITNTLENLNPSMKNVLVPILASCTQKLETKKIFIKYKIDVIFHAAAYKHVPLVEKNPYVGVYNNVWGTLNISKLANQYKISNFILISTDKAVRPTNIMGASKRLSEMIIQAFSKTSKLTKFSIVRFGNVLGSSGSVVPKFRTQIKNGGPVTITHPKITRFFMTIEEAAQLVIQAKSLSKGGEVFLLNMGHPIKILDLATRMIKLSGLTIKDKKNKNGDIELKFIGLRPGEKLYEELLIDNNSILTKHPLIFTARERYLPLNKLNIELKKLNLILIKNDINKLKKFLKTIVYGYSYKL